MIPFASQRAKGQDLATHLQNAHDNEYIELAALRGAIAQDLHGAFAEWEAQSQALTHCTNYLYSLSVNPDPEQDPLSREQIFDYIDRIENRVGLSGQPRAVVFHIKEGREHCHVVWSRIDVDRGKAVHMPYDHDKLMMVTRLFAREHGLELPEGYGRDKGDRHGKNKRLSLYEKHQQDTTGLSKEDRMVLITHLWRASDSAKAFVSALEQNGYMLATGNRPYVLVDLYGNMNALPKMIDDRAVRTKDVQAFLEHDYPAAELPTVAEAKKLAARHRKAIEEFDKARANADQLAALGKSQAARREKLEGQRAAMTRRHQAEQHSLRARQAAKRAARKAAYLSETRRIRIVRAHRQPKGLAAFLGRITGVMLVTKKLHRYRDRKRYEAYRQQKERLADRQRDERTALQRRHEMQGLDLARQVRALDQIEKRERQTLETALTKERRVVARARGGHEHMPSLDLKLAPEGRRAAPHKAKHRTTSPLAREMAKAARKGAPKRRPIDLADEFSRAAGGGRTDGDGGGGSSDGPKPPPEPKIRRPRRRKRDRDLDRRR